MQCNVRTEKYYNVGPNVRKSQARCRLHFEEGFLCVAGGGQKKQFWAAAYVTMHNVKCCLLHFVSDGQKQLFGAAAPTPPWLRVWEKFLIESQRSE